MHDLLYDIYYTKVLRKQSWATFIIHWGLWLLMPAVLHIFLGIIIYYIFISDLSLIEFLLSITLVQLFYFLFWYAADKLVDYNRPTLIGINDKYYV